MLHLSLSSFVLKCEIVAAFVCVSCETDHIEEFLSDHLASQGVDMLHRVRMQTAVCPLLLFCCRVGLKYDVCCCLASSFSLQLGGKITSHPHIWQIYIFHYFSKWQKPQREVSCHLQNFKLCFFTTLLVIFCQKCRICSDAACMFSQLMYLFNRSYFFFVHLLKFLKPYCDKLQCSKFNIWCKSNSASHTSTNWQ